MSVDYRKIVTTAFARHLHFIIFIPISKLSIENWLDFYFLTQEYWIARIQFIVLVNDMVDGSIFTGINTLLHFSVNSKQQK